MAFPKAERCPCCGYLTLRPSARPGRVVWYRNTVLTLPAALRLPACWRCKHEPLGRDVLPPAQLEPLYRAALCQRAALAIVRVQNYRSQRHLERMLGLSQGYLSKLRASDGVPGAPLVSLLALLAKHPHLIGELEDYWTMPPEE